MGGSFALQLACTADDLRAASVFYGQNPRPLEAISRACPIVGNYPERDFTANAARQLEPMLERYHVPHDIKIYPGARHSFFNDQGAAYQAEAATDAWARTWRSSTPISRPNTPEFPLNYVTSLRACPSSCLGYWKPVSKTGLSAVSSITRYAPCWLTWQ